MKKDHFGVFTQIKDLTVLHAVTASEAEAVAACEPIRNELPSVFPTCIHGMPDICQICDASKAWPYTLPKLSALDLELEAMRAIVAAISELDPDAQLRVLHWAQRKFGGSRYS